MLTNKESNCFNKSASSSQLIKDAERRLEAKKTLLKDVEYEVKLLTQDAVSVYKKNVDYDWSFHRLTLDSACEWLSMLKNGVDKDGNKINKRKNYDEKASFDILTRNMQTLFREKNLTIERIHNYNYGRGYDIEFTTHKKSFRLVVPIIAALSSEDYETYGSDVFKLELSYISSDCCSEVIGYTFDEYNLASLLMEYLNGGLRNTYKETDNG